jgi:glycosyltransferase involved in cell wall biosynthesis
MSTQAAPFISVIIPTFNRLELLKETVDSVRGQSYRDFEIIVVNDGCTDGTEDWLDAQKDLRHLDQQNSGIATSRNNGAAVARGTWLAFLDHDDLWAREKLQIQADFVKENPDVGLVAAKHVRIGKKYDKTQRNQWIKGDLLVKAFSESFIHTSSVLIRNDVFEEVHGFPTVYRFADEFDVWLKITAAHPIAYVDDTLVFIRFYESNTSHDRIGVRSDTYDILLKNYDPTRIPRSVFLKTMSNHDISFGRAYLTAGDRDEAVRWFRRSVERTPWRMRSRRYYLRYLLAGALTRCLDTNRDQPIDNRCRFKEAATEELKSYSSAEIDPQAARILEMDARDLPEFFRLALEEHQKIVAGEGRGIRKDARESAVTVVEIPGLPAVCVKEFRWRGTLHALKGLFRATQGLRSFGNGQRLSEEGIGTAYPLALIRRQAWGLVSKEWLIMEVIPGALELDRYILKMIEDPWTMEERRALVRDFGRFLGSLHARCIFHADLKTCNILVSEKGSSARGPSRFRSGRSVSFDLLDYDAVSFGLELPLGKRIRNLVQIFLSTPAAIGPGDRMRFLRTYAAAAGLRRKEARELARSVLEEARGKKILYVGFDGDITEEWEPA